MLDSYADIFARRADRYYRAMDMFPKARDAEFAVVADCLDADCKVVYDMPSGSGWLRRYIADDIRYVAVEPAEYFQQRCPSDERSSSLLAQVEAVPAPAGTACAIISLAGLHHAPDLSVIFAEMHRLLKPGGQLVIADVGAGSSADRFLNVYVDANNSMGHEGRFLDEETARLLVAAGFEVIEDRQAETPWVFGDRISAGAYCRDLFGIDGQSAEQVCDALADIVGLSEGDGSHVVQWSLRRIICRKPG
ncbi:MAG: class I SAM-dependent methyltransferase [Pseudomonadota bacterium]|uniref:class I SAM-dependent methyltransferase n=1 Tax=Rhizorhabdus phycosphaerae TaxID=2711156 RepID=UPI0013EA3E2E|nr:class I SAM-dependent methyltransferase [Rhizorhabdus phycosphaerae]